MIEDHDAHAEQVDEHPKAESNDASGVIRLETVYNRLTDQEHEKSEEEPRLLVYE
jgi:hypothetical protein